MQYPITVKTQECIVCHNVTIMDVEAEEYENYLDGALVQEAFPTMPFEERELFITGTHPACWNILFPPEIYEA